MKKIYWNLLGKEVMFNVNWFEYHILKRVFKKKKYKLLRSKQIRGQKIDIVIVDEACREFKQKQTAQRKD